MPKALDGQILVVQAADLMETLRLIPNLPTWVQCFSMYIEVVVDKEPARTKNILAYLSTIAKCSEVPLGIVDSVRPKLPAKCGDNRNKELVKSRTQHLYPVLYGDIHLPGSLVQEVSLS